MARRVELKGIADEAEYVLEKYKFVLSHFPDAKLQKHYPGFISKNPVFISKLVNQQYTNLSFDSNSHRVTVLPYVKLNFEYKDKKEEIVVHSSPKRNLLARISCQRSKVTKAYLKSDSGEYLKKIIFSRLSINLKNNNFDNKMMNECRAHILKFIQQNPGYKIDDKYLEPRLKKLLAFT